MTDDAARDRRHRRWMLAVGVLGALLPYLARLPWFHGGERRLLEQYLELPLLGHGFLEFLNAIAVAPMLLLMVPLRRFALWLLPTIAGMGFLAFHHAALDLASDAQAAIVLIWIPLFALPWIAGGAAVAVVAGWALRRRGAGSSATRP